MNAAAVTRARTTSKAILLGGEAAGKFLPPAQSRRQVKLAPPPTPTPTVTTTATTTTTTIANRIKLAAKVAAPGSKVAGPPAPRKRKR